MVVVPIMFVGSRCWERVLALSRHRHITGVQHCLLLNHAMGRLILRNLRHSPRMPTTVPLTCHAALLRTVLLSAALYNALEDHAAALEQAAEGAVQRQQGERQHQDLQEQAAASLWLAGAGGDVSGRGGGGGGGSAGLPGAGPGGSPLDALLFCIMHDPSIKVWAVWRGAGCGRGP